MVRVRLQSRLLQDPLCPVPTAKPRRALGGKHREVHERCKQVKELSLNISVVALSVGLGWITIAGEFPVGDPKLWDLSGAGATDLAGISQCSMTEQTLTENFEHGRGEFGYGRNHPTAQQSSFVAQSLKVSEQEFRQILDLTPLFVAVLGPRRERLYINQMGLDFLGTTHNRWRDTRPCAELHPDDLEPVQLQWNHAFSSGLPFECEFRSRRSDGAYRWLLGRCNPVRDEAGQVRRWHAAFTDIEDRKRTEESLQQERAAFRAEVGLDTTRLKRVLDHISANIQSDMTIEDLAGIAGYSAFHFARKFTLTVGIPPRHYIGRLRLENVMAEIEAGKLSLAEIAFNAHFSSQASFTRAFRRVTGTTPNEYRRRRH